MNASGGNYRLSASSPLIDDGKRDETTPFTPADRFDVDGDGRAAGLTPDLDLHPRAIDGDMVANDNVDLGPYEKGLTCCADVAGFDHAIDTSDLLTLLGDWGDCPQPCTSCTLPDPDSCISDVDRNCTVNVSDLLDVLAAWGPCQSATCIACNPGGGSDTQLYDESLETDYGIVSDQWSMAKQFPNPPIYQVAADDFRPTTTDPVTQAHWWGFYEVNGANTESGYADDFTVTYYATTLHPTHGTRIPGDVIATFTSEPDRMLMPDTMGNGLPLYMYTLSHSAVNLTAYECYFIEIRNNGGDTDPDGCHWYWAYSDETEEAYSVFWLGLDGMSYGQMGEPRHWVNLAFGLNIDFERYDPVGYCPQP